MGRTAKDAKKMLELSNQFSPLDLTEGEVQALFNRCLKSADTKEIRYTSLYRKDFGYEETEIPVHFDKDRIIANQKTIMYLIGQLKIIHEGRFSVTEENSEIKYDGSRWTANSGIRAEFLHLAEGAHIMTPFLAKRQWAGLVDTIKPTLSPKDPKFAAWWEAHRGEWES